MVGRRHALVLPALALVLAACTGNGGSDAGGSPSASPSAGPTTPGPTTTGPTSTPTQTSPQGSGPGEPTPEADFPADTAPDGGPAQAGATADETARMYVSGLRVSTHPGYVRVVIDLSTAGVPEWTARYTEASGPGGGPVEIEGDAFLRIALKTDAEAGMQSSSSTRLSPGPVAQVRTTGFFEGYEEVLIGTRGGEQPFRAFSLTDPGRVVIDVKS